MKDRYLLYGLALVAGAALAVWAGLPPSLLLILLVCPLMMFFMMRGMQGRQGPGTGAPRHPDGSHERIDQP